MPVCLLTGLLYASSCAAAVALALPRPEAVLSQASEASSCSDALPTRVSAASVSTWASGFAYNSQALPLGDLELFACNGLDQPAYDAAGDLYVPDIVSGRIYVLGPTGGSALDTALPDARFSVGQLSGLAFGKDGKLYASLLVTNGSYTEPEILQLDPSTGATVGVVTTAADGLGDCPFVIATDPVSGDLFVTDGCVSAGSPSVLERVSDPSSPHPTVGDYTTQLPYTGGLPSAGVAFAPNGTIYVAMPGSRVVVSVSGTNASGTPTVSTVGMFASDPYGVAVASSNASGQATALDVVDSTGTITRVNLTHTPPLQTTVARGRGAAGLAVLGPDGCVYVTDLDRILRLSSGSLCPGTSPCPAPSGRLSGTTLGPMALGFTFAQERRRLPRVTLIGYGFDNFCLAEGWGIRVGYPSVKLLRTLPPDQRARVKGKIVIALTANPYYNLDGVKPGAQVAAVARKLQLGRAFHVGLNYWYIAPGTQANGVLKVRHGIIYEVGIIDKQLTQNRNAQRRVLTSFGAY